MAVADPRTARRSVPTYGNWRRPASPGLLGLGFLSTMTMFAGIVVVLVTWFTLGLPAALPIVVVLVATLGSLAVRDRHGRTVADNLSAAALSLHARAGGATSYRSGPVSRIPGGRCRLPGLVAASELYEFSDSWHRPVALLRVPATSHYSVVLETEPDGASLVDAEQVDAWVATWGAWLASLAAEPGLVAASVTVESAPDSGTRLREEVRRRVDPDAPAVALAMLDEVVDRYPQGSAQVRAWVALTFSAAARPGGRRRRPEEMARDLAPRIPLLGHGLQATGAGATRPVPAAGLCEVVRTAYDPAVATDLDTANATGHAPDLRWDDVGPVATETAWTHYRHDSGVSVTWGMTSPPRGEVYSSVLAAILGPHPDVDRKRVTLVVRPLDPARAARVVETDKRTAEFQASVSSTPSSRALVAQRAAEATAREEATGAALLDFSLLVTATVLDGDRVRDAVAAVDMMAGAARLQLRPMYGSQDAAFVAGLPLGLVLPAHLRIPSPVRDSL
ncbi:MAG: SCO6880 family protein [Kineosporiaceae bacterium]